MRISSLVAMALAVTILVAPQMAYAAALLAVDFGRNIGNDPGAPSPVQAGFNGMTGNFSEPLGSAVAVFGAYTVSLAFDPYQGSDYTRVGFEDTAAASASIDPGIRALYEDAAINNLDLNDGSGITLSIKGVTPNAPYSIKLWSYNAENSFYATPTLFSPVGTTSGGSGSVTQFATPLPTTLDDYSTTIQVSSTNDTLTIHAASTESYGGTRLNGFQLSAVPEPATGLLATCAVVMWGAVRRLGCRRT